MPTSELLILLGTGLVAGVLGGLLGIGGSIVMIPVLTLILHRDQHLSQAAAMIANVAVAVPAVIRHHRAQAVRWDLTLWMIPFGLVCILAGVEASNHLDGAILMRCFGVFLIYAIYANLRKLLQHQPPGALPPDTGAQPEHTGWARPGVVGSITGFFAGLLGIGGGVIAVPLLQRICRLRLRECIATSSAVMCVTAVFGAIRKNMTLTSLSPEQTVGTVTLTESMFIAACLIPTAIVGSMIGANLTHVLPLRVVRVVFVGLLIVACVRFLTWSPTIGS